MKHLAYIDLRALNLTNQNIDNILIANQVQNQTNFICSLCDISRALPHLVQADVFPVVSPAQL